jgi:HK97 family phage portal protein
VDILRRAFPRSEAETFSTYPLSENSEALHELLSGWVGVATNGLRNVDESRALSIPAFGRAVNLISGTIAGLPLKHYTGQGATRTEVPGIFDRPQGPFAVSAFQWTEMVFQHLACYREAFLQELRNDGGAVIGYWPIHPAAVTKVEWDGPEKRFTVHYKDGDRVLGTITSPTTAGAILHVLGPEMTGLRGIPVWVQYQKTFQVLIAAQDAAARVFTGPLIRGLVTTEADEELGDDPQAEAQLIMDQLNARISGAENANQMAFVNRHLKFMPWQQTNMDAQYIETRAFEIEEISRITGVPPHLLSQTEKQTSWGTGVAEQNLGLQRYTLMAYTSRFESAAEDVLPPGEFVEFDYKGMLQGTPAAEITLLIEQVQGGILTPDEARAILNMRPMPKSEGKNAEEEGAAGAGSGAGAGSDTGTDAA